MGINHLYDESFSERVYLPDGQLWGERPYAIVPAYESLNTEDNPIDYCPTHCAMRLTGEVSARMRNKLEALRAKVMENEEWQQKLISKRLITEL